MVRSLFALLVFYTDVRACLHLHSRMNNEPMKGRAGTTCQPMEGFDPQQIS